MDSCLCQFSRIFMNLDTNMLWEGQGVVEDVFLTRRNKMIMAPIRHQKRSLSLAQPFRHNLPTHRALTAGPWTLAEIQRGTRFKTCTTDTLPQMAVWTVMASAILNTGELSPQANHSWLWLLCVSERGESRGDLRMRSLFQSSPRL